MLFILGRSLPICYFRNQNFSLLFKTKVVSVSSHLDSSLNDWTFRKHLHSAGLQISILPHVCSVPIKAAVNKQHLATFPDQDRGTESADGRVSTTQRSLKLKNIRFIPKLPETLICLDVLNWLLN